MKKDTFEGNVEVLKNKHPDIYTKLKTSTVNNSGELYEIVHSKTSLPTLLVNDVLGKYYLHSKYDPQEEARRFIEENYEKDKETYIVYGCGFFYHIKELINRNKDTNIILLETNVKIFKSAVENIQLQDIFDNSHIKLFLVDKPYLFLESLTKVLEGKNRKLIVHLPSLRAMPECFKDIRYMLENYRIERNTASKSRDLLEFNFYENIKNYDENVDVLFDEFENIPAIIVSAGPSLNKNKNLLKHAKNKAIILCVGTSIKPLLSENIYPDIIVITDPQEAVYEQLEGLNIDIPIIVLATCNYKVMQNYKGLKMIAFQRGYYLSEEYANKMNRRMVETGGSVATTALDVALRLKCNPIVFVGQDLAYTNGESHARGTHLYRETNITKGLRSVAGYNGGTVYTSKNLYIYLKWIERRIEQEVKTVFIDATEGGALIQGTQRLLLKKVLETQLYKDKYKFDDIIKRQLKKARQT